MLASIANMPSGRMLTPFNLDIGPNHNLGPNHKSGPAFYHS
jgi:hypothetical protein